MEAECVLDWVACADLELLGLCFCESVVVDWRNAAAVW